MILAVSVAGCGNQRARDPGKAALNSTCVPCHGGTDNQTGAPPVSVTGKTDPTFPGVGAHTAHVTAGAFAGAYECTTCHPDPRSGSTQHGDGVVEVTFSAFATANGQLKPALDATTHQCSNVYCHGATLTGGAITSPEWTKVGQGQAGCGACHGVPPPAPHPAVSTGAAGCQACHAKTVDATGAVIAASAGGVHLNGQIDFGHPESWMTKTSGDFHAVQADRGLATCQLCHGKELDGGVAGIACASCHGPSWRTNCTMCHGGTDNATGAPPRALWGYAGDSNRGGPNNDPTRVGAHTAHVTGSELAPAYDCTACHVKATDALAPGHVDAVAPGGTPLATVMIVGLGAQGTTPSWTRTSATCSSTYCHGATLHGGSNTAPVWTGGAGQAACGTCHGAPPPAPHPNVTGGTPACSPCHQQTVDPSGRIIPRSAGGKHLDGEIQGSGHEASWMDPYSANFHAFSANRDIVSCTGCHGASLEGGIVGVACSQCHRAGGTAPDFAGCMGCHGGVDNGTGAPPRATWGQDADPARGGGSPAERATRVGAHTRHLTGGAIGPAFDCAVCHVRPSAILSPGHIDAATATLTFGGIATAGGAKPGWDRVADRCAGTYCHGATLSGGSNTAPNWTAGSGEAACGTCHGIPPTGTHPAVTGGAPACNACHAQTVDPSGAIIPASAGGKHVNGTIEGGHPASWMDQASPDFHAYSANRGLAACQGCHGARLDGVGGVTTTGCTKCHGASFATTCTMCHGGADNGTGAPPKTIWGYSGDAIRVGAHTKHVVAGNVAPAFDCAVCHVKPADALAAGHVDAIASSATPLATVTFGGIAIQGVGAANAAFTRGNATCASTYCHGNFQGGNTGNRPVWTGGATQGACGSCHGLPPASPHPAITGGLTTCNPCHGGTIDAQGVLIPPRSGGLHLDGVVEFTGGHDASWMDQGSSGFHGFSANRGLAACQFCHGTNLDGVGGSTSVGCQQCHGATWRTNCTMCHGGTDNLTGAPPKATWGQAGDPVRVGAHTPHVGGSALAPAFDCGVCHVKPADAFAVGHIDAATASVTFSGLASQGTNPVWTRSPATCASVYCHGATLTGGSVPTPVWTGGASQGACGACHGVPPPAPHPAVTGGTPACNPCHNATVDTAGNVIPPSAGGKHLDGTVEATGHGADWMIQSSTGFHAYYANQGLANCQSCHGAALDGGSVGVSCAQCHGSAWKTNCTMCHGGGDNTTGAPPTRTWGHGDASRGGGTPDPVRVGAHTAHLTATTFAQAYDCLVCHLKPADALSTGHVDQATATVTFQGLAVAGGAAPTWNRASPTCGTTYCHGNFRNGNKSNAPDWTKVGQGQAACGTCHGLPPASGHPTVTGGLASCAGCHPNSVDASGNVKPAPAGQHLDGAIQFTGGHDATWMDTTSSGFHAFSANVGLASCKPCHGQNLDGVGGSTSVACSDCHRAGGQGHDFGTCTACHGGTDGQTGAPPAATWGFAGDPSRGGGTLDPIRVGAHTIHLAGSLIAPALACDTCHVKPATWLDAGHLDQAYATLTFSQLATAQAATPSWTRASATCASTYCHGAFKNGNTGNAPVWTGGAAQAACGTCHGTPPGGTHPSVTGGLTACVGCHADTIDGSGTLIPPAQGGKHLNGVVDATGHGAGWMDTTSTGFHAYSANQGLASCQSCHGSALDGGSVGVACAQCHGAAWRTSCTMCHGGVNNRTGAPPGATWGHGDPNRGGGTPDPIRVGAHTKHVGGGALSDAFDCSVCHVKPTDALSPGHVDQATASVTFSGLAAAGFAPPSWTRSGATCASTYCHGGYAGTYLYYQLDGAGNPTIPVNVPYAGKNATPVWTGGPMACDSCHDNPPRTGHWHDGTHEGGSSCQTCHSDAVGTSNGIGTGITDPLQHVNGKVDVEPNWIWLCMGCH